MSDTRNVKYLTQEETERLFRVITSVRDRAIFRLAYHRGLRAGEIRLLTMDDYRERSGRLFVHRLKAGGKQGNMSGEYSLTDMELKCLRAWLKERGNDPGPIFLSNRRTAISKQMLDVLMKQYSRAAKIPPDKAHMHTLRHSCATHMLDRGHGIEEIRDHLGHSTIVSTAYYAKITNKRREETAKRLKGWK